MSEKWINVIKAEATCDDPNAVCGNEEFRKLTVTVILLVTVELILARIAYKYAILSHSRGLAGLYELLALLQLAYLSCILIAIVYFKPVIKIFASDAQQLNTAASIFIGIIGGLAASLLSSFLPYSPHASGLLVIAEWFSGSNQTYLLIPSLLILAITIALPTEVFFRGIMLRVMSKWSGRIAGTAATAMLCGYIWPAYSGFAAVLFSCLSAILFFRTNNLWSSISACVSFLCTEEIFVKVMRALLYKGN